jgi:hypothetical protein
MGTDTDCSCGDELSKFLNQRGAKSAKSPEDLLLSLLALPHIGISNKPHTNAVANRRLKVRYERRTDAHQRSST